MWKSGTKESWVIGSVGSLKNISGTTRLVRLLKLFLSITNPTLIHYTNPFQTLASFFGNFFTFPWVTSQFRPNTVFWHSIDIPPRYSKSISHKSGSQQTFTIFWVFCFLESILTRTCSSWNNWYRHMNSIINVSYCWKKKWSTKSFKKCHRNYCLRSKKRKIQSKIKFCLKRSVNLNKIRKKSLKKMTKKFIQDLKAKISSTRPSIPLN